MQKKPHHLKPLKSKPLTLIDRVANIERLLIDIKTLLIAHRAIPTPVISTQTIPKQGMNCPFCGAFIQFGTMHACTNGPGNPPPYTGPPVPNPTWPTGGW